MSTDTITTMIGSVPPRCRVCGHIRGRHDGFGQCYAWVEPPRGRTTIGDYQTVRCGCRDYRPAGAL